MTRTTITLPEGGTAIVCGSKPHATPKPYPDFACVACLKDSAARDGDQTAVPLPDAEHHKLACLVCGEIANCIDPLDMDTNAVLRFEGHRGTLGRGGTAMRLAKLREFRTNFFTPSSAPAESTLRAQIDRDELPGGTKVGHRYYVDLDEYARATNLRTNLVAQQRDLAKNPLLAGLL